MRDSITRILIIIFSVVFAVIVISVFTADRLYSMSMSAETGDRSPEEAITMLDVATYLDPGNADLYFQKYKILGLGLQARENTEIRDGTIPKNEVYERQFQLIRKCIDLRPFWPKYHLVHGLTLKRMSPNPNFVTRRYILSEIKKARDLKPFSKLYNQIYEKYLNLHK